MQPLLYHQIQVHCVILIDMRRRFPAANAPRVGTAEYNIDVERQKVLCPPCRGSNHFYTSKANAVPLLNNSNGSECVSCGLVYVRTHKFVSSYYNQEFEKKVQRFMVKLS